MKVDKTKWKKSNIVTCCDIQLGTRIVKKQAAEGCFPVYGGGGATFNSNTYNRENAILVSRFALSKECTRFIKGKFFLNDSGLTLVPKSESDITFDFLKWQVFGLNDKIYSLARGAAQKNLDMKRFPLLPIVVPTIYEQQAIAAELDAIQKMIDGYKAQITDLDNLAQSIFLNMFGDPVVNPKGWEHKLIKDVCEVASSKRIYQSEQTKSGIPFYRISDLTKLIKENVVIPELYISPKKYEELKNEKLVPLKDDILITSRGTLGLCYIIKESDCFYFQDGMITWLKNIKKDLSPIFLSFIVRTPFFKEQMQKAQNGSTVAYLSISMIKKFKIPLPPLFLQQLFASKVEAIELQKEQLRLQLQDAETLMAERMQYYFS